MSYTIFYDSTNTDLKGYRPLGKKFRVDTKRFGVRVSISVPTEVEALAIIQHLQTLTNPVEVSVFVSDLKAGSVRIVDENATVVDEHVDVVDDSETDFDDVKVDLSKTEYDIEVDDFVEGESNLASILEEEDKDEIIRKLRIENELLKISANAKKGKQLSNEESSYKYRFEFLERTTGGVQKFTDLKNSFFKRLKFLFFPNKY